MQLDERRIQEIVERVVGRLAGNAPPGTPMEAVLRQPAPPAPAPAASRAGVSIPRGTHGVFADVDGAVKAATQAFAEYQATPLAVRERLVAGMRKVTLAHVRELSELAVAETGYGRADDKVKKNTLCAEKTPGPEILRPLAFTGDYGLTILDRAAYGVIGSITPTTNPTETIINNGIGMVSGGNVAVFNPHPYAKRTSAYHIHLLNEAIVAAGGPRNLLCTVAEPTIESAQALMKHRGVRLLVVTGGPAVVKEAMQSGKRAIAAGPGNPPAVVDETASVAVAAQGIVDGASIDNNIVCIAEKEVLVVASMADKLKAELHKRGCYLLNDRQVNALEKVILEDGGKHTNKKWVGKNAGVIAKQIGVHLGDDCRLLIAELPEEHPFVQHELLMPVIGLVRYPDVAAAIAGAVRVEHGFCHTAVMYSTNINAMSAMARMANSSIFVKNGPSLAGLGYQGEGYTSFTIASPTGEGLTTALSFTRERRCTLKDNFRFV